MLSSESSMGKGAEYLFSQGIKTVLVTDGANGAYVCFNGEIRHIPAKKVRTVDTTGAGDIFFGTFLSKLLKGKKRLEGLRFDDLSAYAERAVCVAGKRAKRMAEIAEDKEKFDSTMPTVSFDNPSYTSDYWRGPL